VKPFVLAAANTPGSGQQAMPAAEYDGVGPASKQSSPPSLATLWDALLTSGVRSIQKPSAQQNRCLAVDPSSLRC